MTAQVFQTLSTISLVIAGVCFALAIVLWFVFKIPSVIGDLSGRVAKKSIAKMRAANEKSGAKSYRESRENYERGKLTATLETAGKGKSKSKPVAKPAPKPVNKTVNQTKAKPIIKDSPETSVLTENKVISYSTQETGMIGSEPTGLLVEDLETAPLVDSGPMRMPVMTTGKRFTMIDEVIFIHTNEVIE